jgi:hypothetical protein
MLHVRLAWRTESACRLGDLRRRSGTVPSEQLRSLAGIKRAGDALHKTGRPIYSPRGLQHEPADCSGRQGYASRRSKGRHVTRITAMSPQNQ